MKFREVIRQAIEVHGVYEEINANEGRPWSKMDYVSGLSVDVGDLIRLAMEADGKRLSKSGKNIEHELCDCLWSIIVLAELYDVDLEASFPMQMQDLKLRLLGRSKEAA